MVGTFPLNVQAGSPQYTLTTQISPTSSTTSFSVSGTDAIAPISNAYYTIQNADGSKWCTFYVGQWTTDSTNNYTGTCTYSSSNTSDVFPEGSICWCIWSKEYYDSLIAKIGGVAIKSIEYDLASTTFTITDTNDQVSEINTSPSIIGVDHPPYNLSSLDYVQSGAPLLRFGYHSGSNVSNISDMDIVTPVLSQTHEIYFDVSGTNLYVRKESPAGMYEPFLTFKPIDEGKDSIVVRWRENDIIRFHIPEDNFGDNYSVNISCNPTVDGWLLIYILTDIHQQRESSQPSNFELPRYYLNSASNILYIYCDSRAENHLSYTAYDIYEVTISITRRSPATPG